MLNLLENLKGLTQVQAREILRKEGLNELPSKDSKTFIKTLRDVLSEPMFALLVIAGLIYLALGEKEDAAVLMGFVIISIGLTIYQQTKSDRALESLKNLSNPKALVVRDSKMIRIPSTEVVRGDLLVLEEGDRVIADAQIIEAHDLLIDESLLTGESVPVEKYSAANLENANPEINHVFSGSMIVRGQAKAIVTNTGIHTEIGKIGKSLSTVKEVKSPLSLEVKTLIKSFASLGILLSIFVWVIYGLTRENWLQGLLAGITMAMALLPEEFTVILTVFMALGVWRIARQQVLTRHPPVIETLGNVNVLCVDKTGTLTQNQMSVEYLASTESIWNFTEQAAEKLPIEFESILRYAVLASETDAFDPMEKAFHERWKLVTKSEEKITSSLKFIYEYPLTPERLAMIHLWEIPGQDKLEIAAKGAPETIMHLCKLDAPTQKLIQKQIETLGSMGIRVLAIAKANTAKSDKGFPTHPEDFSYEWMGLAGLKDPLRPEIKSSVKQCHTAGIKVVMITGDHAMTAQAIAKEAGIPHTKYLSGKDLETLSAEELSEAAKDCCLFVRIKPEQKLRLVQILQEHGHVVGMTGDGINDAPALKAAHIGISMGQRGTDVAREASSIVLLNDDFSSIVHAIRLGRRIYENLRKAMIYLVAVHVPIAGAVFLPLILGVPAILTPIHILFLEMIIDPACAIVFEIEESDSQSMNRPPRLQSEKIFSYATISMALIQGLGLLACIIVLDLFILKLTGDAALAGTLSFACLVAGNLLLIISSRSIKDHFGKILLRANSAQWWIIGVAGLSFLAIENIEFLRVKFGFTVIDREAGLYLVSAIVVSLCWFELTKFLFRLKKHHDSALK